MTETTTRRVRADFAYLGGRSTEAEYDRRKAEFDRWLAEHDRALREQIAREIASLHGIRCVSDGALRGACEAIEDAARIARGEQS